jgi:hypothetical protein
LNKFNGMERNPILVANPMPGNKILLINNLKGGMHIKLSGFERYMSEVLRRHHFINC